MTILILEKLSKPSSVKSGVPSSMNDRSVRYMPRYGIHGGSQRCRASRRFRNLPSVETILWSLSIVCLVCFKTKRFTFDKELENKIKLIKKKRKPFLKVFPKFS